MVAKNKFKIPNNNNKRKLYNFLLMKKWDVWDNRGMTDCSLNVVTPF